MAPESPAASRRAVLWSGLILVLAGLAAYQNSFSGKFVFDDTPAILENGTIRQLWPLGPVLSPPGAAGQTVGGRPLLNLSLAIDYAISGTDPWSYHATNLLLHLLAGLTLFGIVRRTLRQGVLPALAAALLWTLHPLQAESVAYVVQRAESLMGLLYLLTVYGFIRYAGLPSEETAGRRGWAVLSVLACLLGMAAKEVMVTAPVIVLLYDRTFVAGTFGEAWRRRKRYYLALAATWILLALLVLGNDGRGGTAGFGTAVSPVDYALTQFWAVAHYLRLALWPYPLVADYGRGWLQGPTLGVAIDAMVVLGLAAGAAAALRRQPRSFPPASGKAALGFAGAWFFLILAPSSSVIPVATETVAEHRMYLPLAAVVVAAVAGLAALLPRRAWLLACGLAAVGCGLMTAERNLAFRDNLALWGDAVEKMPENADARNNLGRALLDDGSVGAALAQDQEAERLNPHSAFIRTNLGNALARTGRVPEAIVQYREALRLMPSGAPAYNDLGNALVAAGRPAEAIFNYKQALRIQPDYPAAENGLGGALFRTGNLGGAVFHFQAALRLNPAYAEAHFNLANAFDAAGRSADAIREYEAAFRLRAGSAEAHNNLAILLAQAGRFREAELHFQAALRLQPGNPDVAGNLARVQAAERPQGAGGP
jgi:Flp pilus assembly protein TadD